MSMPLANTSEAKYELSNRQGYRYLKGNQKLPFLYEVLKVQNDKAWWLSWLERRPVTAEVVGSSPIRVVYTVKF